MKNTPLYNLVKGYKSKMRFHMPGHKGRKMPLDIKCDITELDFSDNLLCPKGEILRLNERLAGFYETQYASVLTCGASSGIHIMLSKFANKKLVVDRYSHVSIYNAMKIYNITPIFINNTIDLCGRVVDISQVEKNIEFADGALLTYPNYYGEIFDIEAISASLRKKGKALLIDGSHAGHFQYSEYLPKSPAKYADICVMSLHKTTLALTQCALITSNIGSLTRDVAKIHSTSPSYLLCCSIDISHANMLKYYERFILNLKKIVSRSDGGDITRLVIDVSAQGLSGFECGRILAKSNIYVEFCDCKNVVCILTMHDSIGKIRRLMQRVLKISGSQLPLLFEPFDVNDNRDFLVKGQTQLVYYKDAINKKSACEICIYPPSVPFVVTGDVITEKTIDIIDTYREYIVGMYDDDKIEVLK